MKIPSDSINLLFFARIWKFARLWSCLLRHWLDTGLVKWTSSSARTCFVRYSTVAKILPNEKGESVHRASVGHTVVNGLDWDWDINKTRMNTQWLLLPMIWFGVTLRSFRKYFFCIDEKLVYKVRLLERLRSITVSWTKATWFEIRKPNYRRLSVRSPLVNPSLLEIGGGKGLHSIFAFLAHRLILSGTPIQNNALELWILFDFLMPGYLGSEKQFIRRYQKPLIASSRDRDLEHGQCQFGRSVSLIHRFFVQDN